MRLSGRRTAWIVACFAVAALLWVAFHRQGDAPRMAPGVPSHAQALPREASTPKAAERKAPPPRIAEHVRAPDLPQHALPEWDAPLEEAVAELRKWSDAGDANAQVQLTGRLKACTPHALEHAAFLDNLDRASMESEARNLPGADEHRAAIRDAAQSRIDRNAEIRAACAKLPKDLRDHWLDPADRAAQAGDIMAMLTYAEGALDDFQDLTSIAANIDEVIERRDKARVYLGEAARRGDKRALVLLAEIYADTQIGLSNSPLYEKDPAQAYAYAFVVSRISGATPHERANMEWLMAASAERLDAQGLARAQTEGERLYQHCCAGR